MLGWILLIALMSIFLILPISLYSEYYAGIFMILDMVLILSIVIYVFIKFKMWRKDDNLANK